MAPTFQPHPFYGMLPQAPGDAYDGFVINLFSKEGRAENKRKRAKKKRKKGNVKAAERLSRRASVLETKASGATMLTDSAKPKALWAVKEPWALRKSKVGKGLEATAEGFRPNLSHKWPERRAVIVGGIKALRAEGISPWADKARYDMELETTVDDSPKETPEDKAFVRKVQKAAESVGYTGSIKTLRQAAEYVRSVVQENNLETTAWSYRKALLLDASVNGYGRKSIIAGALGSAAGLSAGLAVATGWSGVGAVIFGVVAAGLGGAAAIIGFRAKKAAGESSNVAMKTDAKVTARQIATATRDVEDQEAAIEAEAELVAAEEAEANAARLRMLGWAGVGMSAILLGIIIVRSRK